MLLYNIDQMEMHETDDWSKHGNLYCLDTRAWFECNT